MDNREAILARMLVIAEGIEGVVTAARNINHVDDTARPAIVIQDGDESARESDPMRRPARSARRIDMKPSAFLMIGADAADIGTQLNLYRARYLKALLEDDELAELTHDRSGVRYEGCNAVVEDGRKMDGTLELQTTFTYILQPVGL